LSQQRRREAVSHVCGRLRVKNSLPVVLVVVAGLLVTVWSSYGVRQRERLEVRRSSQHLAEEFVTAFKAVAAPGFDALHEAGDI